MCFVHVCLSTVPEDLPYEQLISDAHELFQLYPPSELADEAEFEYENRFGFYMDMVAQKPKTWIVSFVISELNSSLLVPIDLQFYLVL